LLFEGNVINLLYICQLNIFSNRIPVGIKRWWFANEIFFT